MENKIKPAFREDRAEKSSQLQEFLGNTTLHGVRYFNEKSIFRKLVWFIALGAAIGVCSHQVYKTLKAFYGKPFSTTLTKHKLQSMDFPAVTLCNMNMISKKQYTTLAKNWGFGFNSSDDELREEVQTIMSLFSPKYRDFNDEYTKKFRQEVNAVPFFKQRGSTLKLALEGFSHSIEGTLSLEWLSPCTWRGKPCGPSNFTAFVNLKMGQCYTFNSGRPGYPRLKSIVPGPSNALQLKLNLEEYDHVSNDFALETGFKVLIHDPNEYPLTEEFGFALQAGSHTFAAVREHRYKNLRDPYKTKCDSPDTPFTNYLNYSYSVHACIKQCKFNHIIETCHCQPLFNITPGVELCSLKDAFDCIFPMKFNDTPDSLAKCFNQCPEPCEYKKYETKLSYATAVGNSFIRAIPPGITSMIDTSESLKTFLGMSEKEKQEFLRNNVASLDVYFEELGYDIIEQKPVFDDFALLGAVGGTLGLFLGTSVLTVLEFIDFFFVWLMRGLRRDKTRKNSSLTKQEIGEINHEIALDTKIS